MSFFDDASLVMIPSGYKDQKVYSVKPTDGTGDLTFSRASSATRVGPDGLIEAVRTNISLYSEQFDNAYWSKFLATITANSTTAPNGTLTADTITDSIVLGSHMIFRTATWNTTSQTFSIFAKAGTSSRVCILNNSLGNGVFANLADSTIVVDSGFVGTLTAVGNGWFRITAAHTAASSQTLSVGLFTGTSTSEYIGTGSTAFLWGAQLETGDIATDYIATTTAAVSVGPVSGLPRLDYLNSSCPKLLLEPQRTNLALFSEQYDNAAWAKSGGIAVTANAAVSPDGFTNADLIYGATSGFTSSVQQNLGAAGVSTYTNSVFVKYSGKRWFYIYEFNGNSGANFFDIQNGVLGTQNFGSGSFITPYGNGWYRVGFTQSLTSGTVFAIYGVSDANNSFTNTASGTNGAFIWGGQVEGSNSAYATSYIPTLGASVTRVADACSKTSATALIGQTEGTLFSEIEVISGTTTIGIWLRQSGSLYDNMIQIEYNNSSTAIRGSVVNGGVTQAEMTGPVIGAGVHKIALAYKANNFALYVNGVQVGTDSSGTVPTCNEIYIDQYIDGGSRNATKKSALLFKTRLTNAQLAELTA